MINIAFSTISCPTFSLDEIVRAREEYGYDAVELYALDGERLTVDVMSARLDEIQTALRGCPIASINSWAVLSQQDPDARRVNEQLVIDTIRHAEILGSPYVKSFGGELPADSDSPDSNDALDRVAESVQRILAATANSEVGFVVETHDGFCRGADLARLLDRVDDRRFGALWDIFHTHRMGETVESTSQLLAGRVLHAHVKDAVRDGDGWRFVLPWEGEIPVAGMVQALTDQHYSGYLSLDWELMWHPEIAGPEIALPAFREAMAGLIATHQESRQNVR